jgi:hypothetical protein
MTDKAGSVVTDHAISSPDQIETAKWTRHLPQAFGIRTAVQQSKYRWCVRESGLWGIATSTAMSLHRFRMQSRTQVMVNVGFGTFFLVYGGSYYFCVKRRDYREKMIELMMQLNRFEHAEVMPEPVPVDELHPFVLPDDQRERPQQYVAHLPERKDWQPQLPTQDAADVFQPVDTKKK